MNARPRPPARRRLSFGASLALWLALAALAWLDAGAGELAQRAAVFGWLWPAIVWLGNVVGIVGGGIAAGVQAAVIYLGAAVGWLARRVADILFSTGSIFAKTWEGLRGLWSDVVKPALEWFDRTIRRLSLWLQRFLKPVYAFLARVRAELMAIYKNFVRPVLDVIDFLRFLNSTLQIFHIRLLEGLDNILAKIEQRLEEPFRWINRHINAIEDWLDRIVTFDGFLQRVTLLKSTWKYRTAMASQFWNAQSRPLSAGEVAGYVDPISDVDPTVVAASIGDALDNGSGAYGAYVDELAATLGAELRRS